MKLSILVTMSFIWSLFPHKPSGVQRPSADQGGRMGTPPCTFVMPPLVGIEKNAPFLASAIPPMAWQIRRWFQYSIISEHQAFHGIHTHLCRLVSTINRLLLHSRPHTLAFCITITTASCNTHIHHLHPLS